MLQNFDLNFICFDQSIVSGKFEVTFFNCFGVIYLHDSLIELNGELMEANKIRIIIVLL